MRRIVQFGSLVVILMLLASAALAGEAPKKQVIRISIGPNREHPAFIAPNEKFKPIVEAKTNGRYEVQLFPDAALGDDIKATEAVRSGTLDAVVTSSSPLGGLVKELLVFDLPFLFPTEKVADAVLDGPIGAELSTLMEPRGLVNLAWFENGYRQLTNSARPVSKPEDLKGLKIRTMQNQLHLAAWRALGANPTPMPFSEVFTALQQKTIDGQENPIPTLYSAKLYEVQKYVSLIGHVWTPHMLVWSKPLWDKLPKEDQAIFRAAARETALYNRELNRKFNREFRTTLEQRGMIFIDLTPDQRRAFQTATASVWTEFESKIGKEFLDKVKAELKKAQ
jgi:tripartite ATP-independent transporter DctP family solute receptor